MYENLNNIKLKSSINRQDLLSLIDKHFESAVLKEEYDVIYIDPSLLITYNRLDLAIKILYLELKKFDDITFARDLYVQHIKAFSLGSFKEPGNDDKKNLQRYFDDFDCIYESIKKNGIDDKKSLIPLSINCRIANGAHRVSSAYLAKKKIPSVLLDISDDKYDFNFFLHRGMSQGDIETAVTKFIEVAENSYIAIIWPSAEGKQKELLHLFSNIVYQKNISLNHIGAHNLLSQVYHNESWLKSREENFPGIRNKLVKCFKTFDDIRVIAFQAESIENVLSLKEKIRQIFSIGKHSIHISDTKEEAIRISRMLFNENSVHFLNNGNPNKYPSTYAKIKQFKSFIEKNDIEVDKIIFNSSIVLSLYGLRECRDIDYLSVDNNFKYCDELIENHNGELVFHQEEKNELIFNKEFYFYYDDLKFTSFSQLYKMKRNRSEQKDINDLVLMEALINRKKFKIFVGVIKQKYYFFKVKLRFKSIEFLKFIRLYDNVRYIYKAIRNKNEH